LSLSYQKYGFGVWGLAMPPHLYLGSGVEDVAVKSRINKERGKGVVANQSGPAQMVGLVSLLSETKCVANSESAVLPDSYKSLRDPFHPF
jgi:hypothetical protein